MTRLQIELPEQILDRIKNVADDSRQPIDRVIEGALEQYLAGQDGLAYLRSRAERGRHVDIKAILRKAPGGPPNPGDELPD